ncbi:deoxyribonuclease [Vibrio sp. 10N.286.49.B3]|uniref:TatD family hydrolase n=1 Tax=Vibrio sp. 10N.286.49.B3 TaxID=1880855 RepID=UPI000C8527F3|nr:TatD family hydrolase [Vibrio sp. 10N.286.49.B3]PMH41180.1 deoxyribonuclease [Vibrio sp. 10N.286.49.B3]
MLFDTHCHFDFDVFAPDFEREYQSSQLAGVQKIVLPSVDSSNWQRVMDLSSRYVGIYYALGIHPRFIDSNYHQQISSLQRQLVKRDPRCVAIGECGLDFSSEVSQSVQEEILSTQILLAIDYKLPLILHCRKSHNRLIQIIKRHKFSCGGILHGFTGSFEQAMEWVKMGFFIGVGGSITYPRAAKTRKAIAQLPLSALVLETDAPDMPICGYQGLNNHPKYLPLVLKELVLLRMESAQTVSLALWKNSHQALKICEITPI